MHEKILLIDGNSIINRAFYAIPILTNKDGIYTNAVYGFLNIMFKFLDEENPNYLAVAFDFPSKTFRHGKFSDYKGTRKGTPDELRPQVPLLKELLEKMNIACFEKEGFEADDILGTLSKKSEQEGLEVTIVSGDRDMLQLATDKTKIKIPKTKGGKTEVEEYKYIDVIEKIGVTPKEYIDVKALMGDSSDNIPGVPSIGEKTALKIISEYKNIETAIENYESIKPKKASENLNIYKEQALLSKELATIVLDVPVDFDIGKMEIKNLYTDEALEKMNELNFKTFLNRFDKKETVNDKIFLWIEDNENIENIIDKALEEEYVAYYLLNIDNIVSGISLSYENLDGVFIPFNSFNENEILNLFKRFFESDVKKISLNSKFEKVYLDKFGIEINNIIFDISIAGYIINSSKTSYNYNDIALDFFGENYQSEEDIFGKGKSKKTVIDIEKEQLLKYACLNANIIFKAYFKIHDILKENNQLDLYYKIELPLVDVLKDMELYGIKVDKKELIDYQSMLKEKLDILTEDIYSMAGEEFNINSPQQLGIILFEKLGLKAIKKTKTGYSTSHDVLVKLRNKHPIINSILDYRTLSKLKSTYADGLLNVLNPQDNKIYSTFNQLVTTTGRISSTEPNLQNIPVKMEIGRILRKVFIPSGGDYVFLDGDYSQIELRVLADISGDETLINAFINNEDIHRITASQVFDIPFELVTETQRSNAKAVNFGIVYGIGAYSLSEDLSITRKEADRYIEGYFKKYPKVKEYLDNSVKTAEEKGYAETIFNRRRDIPELSSSNFNLRGFGQRVAMNMPIQGTAADIIKIAMVKVRERIKKENFDARLILQVHDELLLEVNKNQIDEVLKAVKEEMENAVQLKIPLKTDFNVGDNWYDAK